VKKFGKGGLHMKRFYTVIIALLLICTGLSCSSQKPIPVAAISEIFALGEARSWLYGNYVEVKDVQDRSDSCYIMIYIKSLPKEVATLKDADDKASVFTKTFIDSAVKILNKYKINKDVSVWAQLLLKDGAINVLGHAQYDAKKHKFHDFERYDPKPDK
jgi:hypothetical protein